MNTLLRPLRLLLPILALAWLALANPAAAADSAAPAPAPAHSPAAHAADHHHAQDGEPPSFLQQVGYSYLTAYMFCLSLVMGSLFLILVHHLFDAGWSVPVRRVAEQLSSLLFPWMLVLVVPILALANLGYLHPWMKINPAEDHALDVKKVLFNPVAFSILVPLLIASWGWMAHTFRRWSMAQDKDGAAVWTGHARKLAAAGIFYFALTLTLVCFYLMKSLQHQFFSTMYGVYYFAGSVWTTLATMWVLALVLRDRGPLRQVVHKRQIQDLGVWFFAFTVFYAYIHFSQYFLIWNAAIPEETFWYVKREAGSWKWVGFTILFGHFFVPFLLLLNQDIKLKAVVMIPMAAWAWLMHYVDMTFNVMPVLYPDGLHVTLLDPLFWLGMAGFLGFMFWRNFHAAAPYPLRDPRLKEAVTHHEVPAPGATHH
ncbi:MAG: hypothetical protein ACKOET_12715 [Verrucomicrobiota bacterium]